MSESVIKVIRCLLQTELVSVCSLNLIKSVFLFVVKTFSCEAQRKNELQEKPVGHPQQGENILELSNVDTPLTDVDAVCVW